MIPSFFLILIVVAMFGSSMFNVMVIIANTTMNVAQAILTEASLSFLGLGDPNVVSWGQMIMSGKSYLVNGWWISLFAGLAIMLVVIVFYMIGDGLNYAMNPKLQSRK